MVDDGILDAAQRVISERGLHAATLEGIAQAAGVSRVTLHRRGLGREEIIGALADRALARYQRALWPVLTAPGPARERLEHALVVICEQTEAHLALLVGLQAMASPGDHDDVHAQLTRPEFTEPLERLLRDGVADGTLRAGDPVETATALVTLVGYTYLHLRHVHLWSPEHAQRCVHDLALHGVVAT